MLSYFRKGFLRRYIRMRAIRQGVIGGSRPWLAVFILGYLARSVSKVTKRGEMPIALSEALKPGEKMIITHIKPPSRRARRAAQSNG
jgi:hypothetical protein